MKLQIDPYQCLQRACENERATEVQSLLTEYTYDPVFLDEMLDMVADRGYTRLTKMLLDFGAGPLKPEHFMNAIKRCRLSMVHMLLSEFSIWRRNNAAFIAACESGHVLVVALFVEYGSDPDINLGSANPMMIACRLDHLDIVKYLFGRNPDIKKYTCAFICACEYDRGKIVRFFIDAGFDPRGHERAALINACRYGYMEIVKILVNAGVDIQFNNNEPLAVACVYGHTYIAKLLLAAGADPRTIINVRAAFKQFSITRIGDLCTSELPSLQQL